MKITKRRLRKILIESLLLESRKTSEWIMTQPPADQVPLLDAYNKGLTVIDQLSWIQKVRGTEPIQDVVADVVRFFEPQVQAIIRENGFQTNLNRRTYPTVGELRRVISQVDALINSRKAAKSPQQVNPIDDPYHVDQIAKVGPWTILMPRTVTGSVSCDISGKDTSWCTTKSRGQNLFLSYVGREDSDIILFYVMDYSRTPDDPYKPQQEACLENNDSRLSIGFINGEPVLKGQSGGLSVDAANMGLNKRILRSSNGLGQYYDQIMGILSAEAQAIGSTHPAKESIKRARKDLLYLKSVIKDYDKDAKQDYLRQIAENLNEASPEVLDFMLFTDPNIFYDIIRMTYSGRDNSENVELSQELLEKIYNEFSTKRMNIGNIFPQYGGGGRFSSDMLVFDVLTFKSYLMSEEMFNRFFDLYNDLLDERLVRTGQMRLGTVISPSLRMEKLIETIISYGPTRRFQIHPIIAQKIQELNEYELSDEGIENAIDNNKQNEVKEVFYRIPDDQKEEFYDSQVSTRFEHALRTFRYIIEEGPRKFTQRIGFGDMNVPVLDQRDGIALSIVLQEMNRGVGSRDPNNTGFQPKLVQDVELSFTSVFPEFYQMSGSQFKKFIAGFQGSNNVMISKYVKDSGLTWLYGFGLQSWDVSFFNILIKALISSPFISEKMANYVKNNMSRSFASFLSNPKYASDQYLVDLYRVLRYYSASEGPQLPDTQYTRTIEADDKGYFGDIVYGEIEDRAFNSYPTTWTLGEEILEELNIEPGDY